MDHSEMRGNSWQQALWRQFGAAIEMLRNAIDDCPDSLWQMPIYTDRERPDLTQFWYVAYHSLFWLDFYLTPSEEEEFAPPSPFTLSELDPAGIVPDPPYDRATLQRYADYCRQKCHRVTTTLTDVDAASASQFVRGGQQLTHFELHLYNMRHVQEHAGQLAMAIGQQGDYDSQWVGVANKDTGKN